MISKISIRADHVYVYTFTSAVTQVFRFLFVVTVIVKVQLLYNF